LKISGFQRASKQPLNLNYSGVLFLILCYLIEVLFLTLQVLVLIIFVKKTAIVMTAFFSLIRKSNFDYSRIYELKKLLPYLSLLLDNFKQILKHIFLLFSTNSLINMRTCSFVKQALIERNKTEIFFPHTTLQLLAN
jgi:hypothetical protein